MNGKQHALEISSDYIFILKLIILADLNYEHMNLYKVIIAMSLSAVFMGQLLAQNDEIDKYASKYSFEGSDELFKVMTQIPNDSCRSAIEICNNSIYTAGTNTLAEAGPNYQCLTATPNPAWFIIHPVSAGTLAIQISSIPERDLDFICWGYYEDPISPCTAGLTANKVLDCDYSTSANPLINIYSAVPGKYYLLMVTNYSNQPCDITFKVTTGQGILEDAQALSISVSEPEYCINTTLTASDGFDGYLWNNGLTTQTITVSEQGIYTVKGFNNSNCTSFSSIDLPGPRPPVPGGPITISDSVYCDSTILTAPDGYTLYKWNTGMMSRFLEVRSGGVYSVTAQRPDGCTAYSEILVNDPIPVEPAGDILISDSTYCYSTTLTAQEGYESYLWNTGQSGHTIEVTDGGIYTVIARIPDGCKARSEVWVPYPIRPYHLQDICMVTFDETIKKNKVIIEKAMNEGIDSLLIYRRDNGAGPYDQVHSIGINQESFYIDNESTAEQSSYDYAVAVLDTCGNKSGLSDMHRTMVLGGNIGPYNTVNLSWTAYEGIYFNEYEVFRNTNGGPYIKIGVVDFFKQTFTDLMPLMGTNSYQVRIVKNDTCIVDNYSFDFVGSNIIEVNIVGLDEQVIDLIEIYPNPAKNILVIKADKPRMSGYITLYDNTGKLILNNTFQNGHHEMDVSSLSRGIYAIRLVTTEGIFNQKIVVAD